MISEKMDQNENRLENRIFKEPRLFLVPGTIFLDARKEAKAFPEDKIFLYGLATELELVKIVAYATAFYELYSLIY